MNSNLLSVNKNLIGFALLIVGGLCYVACSDKDKKRDEITAMPVQLEIERFDQKFSGLDAVQLQQLKREYPFLFPPKYTDSIWLAKSRDTLQLELASEVLKKFPKTALLKNTLVELFKHIKYYFPEVKTPRVVTITSDVNYEQKVILADSLLLISLDTYLGEDHFFYRGIQKFIRKNFKPSQIAPDIASRYVKEIIPLPKDRTFLGNLIFYGKEIYLKSKLLPNYENYELIGYTKEEYDWAQANEEEIWILAPA